MMHILLMILKIIGIVLLTAAGILLLTLFLALFCPVVYRGRFTRSAEGTAGSLSISWLFWLVRVKIFYDNGKHGFRIRFFGIPLDALGRLLSGWQRGRQSSGKEEKKPGEKQDLEKEQNLEKEKEPEEKRSGVLEKKQVSRDKKALPDKSGEETEEKPFFLFRFWKGIVSFFRMLMGLPSRIVKAVRGFFQKISEILQKIDRFREFLGREEFLHALGLLWGSAGKLLRHVRPRKIRGSLCFGFEDPAHTGLCLGGISVIYPWYHKSLMIEPDFQQKRLEADLGFWGEIFGVYALYIFLKIYFDKNVKYCINRFRDKEAR